MKNRNIRLLKGISLSFCILIGIIFPLLFSFFDTSNLSLDNRQDSGDMFVSSVNGKNYLAKYITAEDIEDMKKKSSIQSPIETWSKPNSINLIDGHGMGYATPSSEDLESLIGKVSLLDVIPENGQK